MIIMAFFTGIVTVKNAEMNEQTKSNFEPRPSSTAHECTRNPYAGSSHCHTWKILSPTLPNCTGGPFGDCVCMEYKQLGVFAVSNSSVVAIRFTSIAFVKCLMERKKHMQR